MKHWYSGHSLVQALAAGILAADPYWIGYRPPPGFADVLADFAHGCDAAGDKNGAFEADHDEVRKNVSEFVHGHPICVAWNQWDDPDMTIAFTSRYSPMPLQRQFIDLDAIVQNAMNWLRDYDRRFAEVDAAVEKRATQ